MARTQTKKTLEHDNGDHGPDSVSCCCECICALTQSVALLHMHSQTCSGAESSHTASSLQSALDALQYEVDCLKECCGMDLSKAKKPTE